MSLSLFFSTSCAIILGPVIHQRLSNEAFVLGSQVNWSTKSGLVWNKYKEEVRRERKWRRKRRRRKQWKGSERRKKNCFQFVWYQKPRVGRNSDNNEPLTILTWPAVHFLLPSRCFLPLSIVTILVVLYSRRWWQKVERIDYLFFVHRSPSLRAGFQPCSSSFVLFTKWDNWDGE